MPEVDQPAKGTTLVWNEKEDGTGIRIEVSAPEGVLAEGTSVIVEELEEISDNNKEKIIEDLENRENETVSISLKQQRAFDIKLMNAREEIQPEKDKVSVTFSVVIYTLM